MIQKKTVPRKRGTENDRNRGCRLLNISFSEQGQVTIEVERPTAAQAEKNGRYIEMIRRRTREVIQ